ncbi:interferon regulatory factor 7, isoform CRA_a [Rattus norvegicus]|uniref:Interferon regulatory factor 7, isoform CRA_a n=1 Tax=Rattus norvegicus TaxID=10116 RepID=A6HXS6_RAT|nr:interferon regulatory factor 7, isoform CRA_a [Rattus norvegicus]
MRLTQSSVCPGSISAVGIWMKLMHRSSRPGLWPEGGGHLVELTYHPQRLRLLSEEAGRPTSDAMVGHPRCVFLYSPVGSAIRTSEPQPVIFPSPAELPDQKQLHYTETLLQHVSPGLQLELRGPSLWALRMGKCKVYWGGGQPYGLHQPLHPSPAAGAQLPYSHL